MEDGIIKTTSIIILIALILSSIPISSSQEKVTISGSSTTLPLVEACAEAFNHQQNDYFVTVVGGGTGAGIVGIAERRYSLAMASRELDAAEINKFGNKFLEFLIAYDGIIIAVSAPVYQAGVDDLSKEQVRKVYAGEIDNWRVVGGLDRPIYAVGREPGSGTRKIFNEIIFGDITAETLGVDTVALGSAEAKTAILGSDKGIGYFGFSYAEGEETKAVKLDGIPPTIDNVRNKSYPLSRGLYLYSHGVPGPGAMAFIQFMQSPSGQKIAEDNGFIPILRFDELDEEEGPEISKAGAIP